MEGLTDWRGSTRKCPWTINRKYPNRWLINVLQENAPTCNNIRNVSSYKNVQKVFKSSVFMEGLTWAFDIEHVIYTAIKLTVTS